MFLGEFAYRLDEKGRVPIPPKFKKEPKEGVVLTPRVEKGLIVYPLAEWKKPAVCNFLVRMHLDRFRVESRQLDNKGERNQNGRF